MAGTLGSLLGWRAAFLFLIVPILVMGASVALAYWAAWN